MDRIISEIAVVLAGIIGLAIIATLVSRNAQTPQVIKAAAGGFSDMIRAATGPVSGSGFGSMSSFGGF